MSKHRRHRPKLHHSGTPVEPEISAFVTELRKKYRELQAKAKANNPPDPKDLYDRIAFCRGGSR